MLQFTRCQETEPPASRKSHAVTVEVISLRAVAVLDPAEGDAAD
jgi:hypothetical protein